MFTEKKFKVNEYITLKLEDNVTNIYINEEMFQQCKFLLINIPVAKISDFDKIESIDEVAVKLRWTEDGQKINNKIIENKIPPNTEFWGHCSNLQAWAENNYNTCLLHSNLAFPLLNKLSEVGDGLAKKIFKEEIAKRLENCYPSVVQYLWNEGYLNYLESEELFSVFSRILNDEEKFLKRFQTIFSLLRKMKKSGISLAKQLLQEEVSKGFLSGNYYIIKYLLNGNYLSDFTQDELDILFENFDFTKVLGLERTNLSYLLIKLNEMGVNRVRDFFKEFIAYLIRTKNWKDFSYYMDKSYLKIFKQKDLNSILENFDNDSILEIILIMICRVTNVDTQFIKKQFEKNLKTVEKNCLLKLHEEVSCFYNIWYDSDFLTKMSSESFFYELLMLILNKNNSDAESYVIGLMNFFDTMLDLYWFIEETIVNMDTPAGPIDEEDGYKFLVPKLKLKDNDLNLYGEWGDYDWVIEKLRKALDYEGKLIKTEIFHQMDKLNLLKFPYPSIESLNEEMIKQIFSENFKGKNFNIVFDGLRTILTSGLIKELKIQDFVFDFLEEEDAKVILELCKLKLSGLKLEYQWSSNKISNTNGTILFDQDKKIIGINLTKRKLVEFPECILNLKKLRILDLSLNKIEKLPNNINELKCLEKFYLNDNQLIELPESFEYLKSLKMLILKNNKLTSIDTLRNLPKLEFLHLGGNVIKKFQNLKNLTNLKSLHLDKCNLTSVDVLPGLNKLEFLSITNNKIKNFKDFNVFPNLRFLKVGQNKLTEFPPFDNLKRLTWLDLSYNEIQSIPNVNKFRGISRLNIGMNLIPWEELDIFVRKHNLIKPLDFEKFDYLSLDK